MNAQLHPQDQSALHTVTTQTASPNADDILQRAQQYALTHTLDFSGSLSPIDAWQLIQQQHAILIDVRTNEERKFVGYIPQSLHIPWATGTAFNRNPRFLKELESKVSKDQIILLICRSGRRSSLAAVAAFNAGFKHIYNVLEGFEGDIDANGQRGKLGGWRHAGLPWKS